MRVRNRIIKKAIDFIAYIALVCLLKILEIIPRRAAIGIGETIAQIYSRFDAHHRRIAKTNLSIAFPHLSEKRKELLIRAAYRNFGRMVIETARIGKLNSRNISQLVEYDPVNGLENFLDAMKQGKGVIFMTGHFGAWELVHYAHALYGYPLSFVVRKIDNPYVDRLMRQRRQSAGSRVIEKRQAVKELLKELRRGGVVGILADQNVSAGEGVFVDFFGKPACTSTIVAVLALRTGAPVIPAVIEYDRRRDKHRMVFLPAVELIRTGDYSKDVELNTAQFNKIFEGFIRRSPHLWLWMHRRWKTRPEGELAPAVYAG